MSNDRIVFPQIFFVYFVFKDFYLGKPIEFSFMCAVGYDRNNPGHQNAQIGL